LLGGVFKAKGNASPVMVPAKGAYFSKDMARYAERYGVTFTLPTGFPINTLHLMRLCAGFESDARFCHWLTQCFRRSLCGARIWVRPTC
jgi:2-hydroxychromene-2-carboxylate isomerase